MFGKAESCLLLFLLCSWSSPGLTQDCSIKSPVLRFTVTSHRNGTGHWVSKVQFHPGEAEKQYQVHVDTGPEKYDGVDMVHVAAEVVGIEGPRKPLVAESYTLLPNLGYYKVHPTLKTWPAAKITCEQEGAHLLVLNSQEEASAVMDLRASSMSKQDAVYVSIVAKKNEGDYRTIFGDPLSRKGYVHWTDKLTDNSIKNEDCVSMLGSGIFYDVPCMDELAFICELELHDPKVNFV